MSDDRGEHWRQHAVPDPPIALAIDAHVRVLNGGRSWRPLADPGGLQGSYST